MKRNINGGVGALVAVSTLGGFLLLEHSNLASVIPFDIPFISHHQEEEPKEYKPIGRMVLDGQYELGPDWTLTMDKSYGTAGGFTISHKDKQLYRESLTTSDRLQPVMMSAGGANGYLTNWTGNDNLDFVLEQQQSDSTAKTGERYTYTMYAIGQNGVERFRSQQFDSPLLFKDVDKDGALDEVCQDSTFVDFDNDKHLGGKEQVMLAWGGSDWAFSSSMMTSKPLGPIEFNKLATDINSKIIRYDTPGTDGKPTKRIEIHPNSWQPIIDLIYHGQSVQAHKLLDRIWKDNETTLLDNGSTTPITKADFWNQILERIKQSPYHTSIQGMNGFDESSDS